MWKKMRPLSEPSARSIAQPRPIAGSISSSPSQEKSARSRPSSVTYWTSMNPWTAMNRNSPYWPTLNSRNAGPRSSIASRSQSSISTIRQTPIIVRPAMIGVSHVRSACDRQAASEPEADPNLLASGAALYYRPTQAGPGGAPRWVLPACMERTTGFEPATPTLATSSRPSNGSWRTRHVRFRPSRCPSSSPVSALW
jgi:hypothetical protein